MVPSLDLPDNESELSENETTKIVRSTLENNEEWLSTKVQEKIEFKDSVSQDDGTNDYASWKRLGVFIVNHQVIPDKLAIILDQAELNDVGSNALELHIPPQEMELDHIEMSLKRIAEYLDANKDILNYPRYIYGVSYLAKYSRRWGFKVVSLPNELKRTAGAARLLDRYRNFDANQKKRKIANRFTEDDIQLCYIPVEDFLLTYLPLLNNNEIRQINRDPLDIELRRRRITSVLGF